MLRKLLFLTLALAATVGLSLSDVRPAEAACKKSCWPDGPCITCCQAPCPTMMPFLMTALSARNSPRLMTGTVPATPGEVASPKAVL